MVSRSSFLCLALCSVLSLSSCVSYRGVFAKPSPTPGTKVSWPNVNFTEVRGYCYDYTAESKRAFLIEGRMHKGVMDPKGVKLTPEQVKQLLAAVTTSHPMQERTACYKPHHAFLFFDAQGHVAAEFDMCFGCNKFVATPPGVPEYIDYSALASLVEELGLPMGHGNPFYIEAVRSYRASH